MNIAQYIKFFLYIQHLELFYNLIQKYLQKKIIIQKNIK